MPICQLGFEFFRESARFIQEHLNVHVPLLFQDIVLTLVWGCAFSFLLWLRIRGSVAVLVVCPNGELGWDFAAGFDG